uniref:uncharacterized protein LOC120334057 isoform X1 n=1 Tax=Styela clava TaxID=7725 RepID=UPI00193A9915|nr:uncharacterized protein LOC120334057 isoform X1 [Styela clava]
MLRFIRKRVRSKASNLGDDVEVYSKRVRSKASDHKDNVEVYSKRRKQKLYQKSERILSSVFTFIFFDFFNFFNPLHKVFPTFDTANPCRVINCDPSDLHRAAARVFWGSGPPFKM